MDISLQQSVKPIVKFISKHHLTIFITLLGALLIGALVLLLSLLTTSQTTDAALVEGDRISSTFDTKTADQLNALQSSSQTKPIIFPKNSRYNPFVE
ncbi:MAG: hypothetical protein EOO17_03630 [Chloroflexi bacterium]|nr:MAG: hypothetical protein EOO17_03630 [Chloroflexota bacterium]